LTSLQLRLDQGFNNFELSALMPLIPFVTKRVVIDSSDYRQLTKEAVAVFTQAPSPWPFCPNVCQLTLPFWRAILSGSTCEALGQADRTATSWIQPVVQGIARQESLYVANPNANANKTVPRPARFFSKDFRVWPMDPKHLLKRRSEQDRLEAECGETKSAPSDAKTTL